MQRRELLEAIPLGGMVVLSGCLSPVEDILGIDGDPEPIDEQDVVDETILSQTQYTVYLSKGNHLVVAVADTGRLGATISVVDPDESTVERLEDVDEATLIHVAEVAGTFEVVVIPDETADVEIVIEVYGG